MRMVEFNSPQVDKNNAMEELKLWRAKLRRTNILPNTSIGAL